MRVKHRKLSLAGASLLSAFVLALFGKLTGDYATIVTAVVGAFSTADALITRKSLERVTTSPTEGPPE